MRYLLLVLIMSAITSGASAQKGNASKTDSTQIVQQIMAFYKWYGVNHAKLNSFELYRGTKKPDEPPYKINWKEAERYFAYIRAAVPYLNEAFIANRREFLKECDVEFKNDPEGEIPYGFDYDWYTNSQEETEYLVEELKKTEKWVIRVTGGTHASVEAHRLPGNPGERTYAFFCMVMNKVKGKWTIGRIGCQSPENEPPPVEELKNQ